jgi:uncharacterized membrane-anchored protein
MSSTRSKRWVAVLLSSWPVGSSARIHTIFTTRRELFYWLAVLFTFALGTAAGDLVAEGVKLGYLATGLLFGGIIVAIALDYYLLGLNSILSFWLVYILTRPVGASLGDFFSQPGQHGGLGLGTTMTSFIFLAGIALLIMTLMQPREQIALSINEAAPD